MNKKYETIKQNLIDDIKAEREQNKDWANLKSIDKGIKYLENITCLKCNLGNGIAFIKPSGHLGIYWGLSNNKHITLTLLDRELMLSVITEDSHFLINEKSSIENFEKILGLYTIYRRCM